MVKLPRIALVAGAIAVMAVAVVVAASGGQRQSAPAASPSAATASACSAPQPLGAGTRTIRLDVGGRQREAYVQVPRGAVGHAAPLVVAFHGMGSTGPYMADWSGLAKVADREGVIVAYPTATSPGRAWTLQPGADNQDVAFVRALIPEVAKRWCVDDHRVSAAGVSNGGGFTARVACDMAPRLAGAVVVAGAMTEVGDCRSGPPVSILEVHGTDDQVAGYDAANGTKGVLDWLSDWRARDGCSSQPPQQTQPLSIVSRITWGPCANGTVVEHLRITGGRHQWPGSSPSNPGPTSGLSAAEETWSFLASHRSLSPAF
jgi:polyhydroxybutyrate depolymerase